MLVVSVFELWCDCHLSVLTASTCGSWSPTAIMTGFTVSVFGRSFHNPNQHDSVSHQAVLRTAPRLRNQLTTFPICAKPLYTTRPNTTRSVEMMWEPVRVEGRTVVRGLSNVVSQLGTQTVWQNKKTASLSATRRNHKRLHTKHVTCGSTSLTEEVLFCARGKYSSGFMIE